MSTRRGGIGSVLFLCVFIVPFLGGGCVTGFIAGRLLARYVSARGWVETPATIQTVALKSHRGSKGGVTYEVACTYAYTFGGREYTSERVGLDGSSDNIGHWHQVTFHRLQEAQARGQPVPCFVNPANPAQALLDREMRFWKLFFWLLFPALFGGVGLAFASVAVVSVRKDRRARRYAEEAGAGEDEPWRWDVRWASGVIRPNTGAKMAWAIGAALFWNIVWSPILFFVPGEIAKGDYRTLLALIPAVIGVILFVWAVRATIQNRKFGRSRFECRPLPGEIGGHLRGDLVLSGDIATLDEVQVTLRCRNSVTTRRGSKRSTHVSTLWEHQQTLRAVPARFGETELRLAVDFQIPADCRPTDEANGDDKVFWRLLARAAAVGVDLALEFEVPVFRISAPPGRFRAPA